jgi:hypothetical protein
LLTASANLLCLGSIQKDDARRVADGGVVASKGKRAGLSIHLKNGDIVSALIATV